MDTTLLALFTASFHSDANVRIAAELQLRKVEGAEGLIPTLLHLIAPSSTSPVVRLAASIYLKNRIVSSWRVPSAENALSRAGAPYTPIHPSDRQALKSNILPLLASLANDPQSASIKAQVESALARVVDLDFPGDWPSVVDEIGILLGGDEGQIEAGLLATVQVLRGFRYSRTDPDSLQLNSLVAHLFPQLLQLAQRISTLDPTTPATLASQGILLHLIIKSYKHSISATLSPTQQASDSIIPWGTLFLSLAQKPLPFELLPADVEARETHPWSKVKKWSLYTLNRLFSRYGNPSQLPSNMKKQYHEFSTRFIAQFVPEVMRTYLGIVERVVGGEWVAGKVKHHLLSFFEECVKPKSTWLLFKPAVQTLIEQFAFPLICLTEAEIECFTEDPVEYSRSHFGDFVEDQFLNPCSSALSLVAALVEGRKATTLMPLLNFIQGICAQYPATSTPREKDGALRMLSSLAHAATKNSKIAPMMESFFQIHVLPEYNSSVGILRCRVSEVITAFEACDMEWKDRSNLETMFRAVMGAVSDAELPVRIQAAIALPEMVRYEEVREAMVPNIGRIMQELLKMTDEVELDALTNTTRSLVAEFAEEVVPFAVELSASLMETYVRLVQETIEARAKEEQSAFDDLGGEEKTLVCMNLLKTIDQLVSSLEKAPVSLAEVELIVAPALELTIRANLVELYDEVFEIADSLAFFQKAISPAMFGIFEATYHSFKSEAIDYFNEMAGTLDNIVSFGGATLAASEQYKGMLLDMFETVMTSRMLGAEDRCAACKLAEAMLLNLRGSIDEAVPSIVRHSMGFLLSKSVDEDFTTTPSLHLHSLLLVIASLNYSPALTLSLLSSQTSGNPPLEWKTRFFGMWFKDLSKLSRVHDRKLSIGAICEVIEWLQRDGEADSLVGSLSQLLVGALVVFKDLPGALQHRAQLEKDFAEGEDGDESFEEDSVIAGDDENEVEEDVFDKDNDYLEMLAKAQDNAEEYFGGDSDAGSNWSEEILWASPLDQFDAYTRFTACLTSLEIINPRLFGLATGPLDLMQRSELEAVAARALQGGEKAIVAPATPV